MHIIRAQPDQAAILTDLAFAAKRHWDYPESYIESWRAALTISPAMITQNETYVAVIDDRIVGFHMLHNNGDELELAHLWVLPEMMGRGIGRLLFTHAVQQSRQRGFQRLTIESDPNAEGFYLRLGARRVGTKGSHVQGQLRELPVMLYELK